jgi:hypothetical protein
LAALCFGAWGADKGVTGTSVPTLPGGGAPSDVKSVCCCFSAGVGVVWRLCLGGEGVFTKWPFRISQWAGPGAHSAWQTSVVARAPAARLSFSTSAKKASVRQGTKTMRSHHHAHITLTLVHSDSTQSVVTWFCRAMELDEVSKRNGALFAELGLTVMPLAVAPVLRTTSGEAGRHSSHSVSLQGCKTQGIGPCRCGRQAPTLFGRGSSCVVQRTDTLLSDV